MDAKSLSEPSCKPVLEQRFCAAPNCEQGPMESSCTGTRRRPTGMSRMNVQYLEAETQGVIRAPATPVRNACNGLVILAQSAGPHGCSFMDLMRALQRTHSPPPLAGAARKSSTKCASSTATNGPFSIARSKTRVSLH